MSTDVIHVRSRSESAVNRVFIVLLFMVAGLLLARIQLISMICPFGPAFVAACFLARREVFLFAASGVLIGALLVSETLYIVIVTLLICAAFLFIGKARRWMVIMSTACAYSLVACVFRTENFNSFMTAVLECLVGLIMIYVLFMLMQIFMSARRTLFSTEETICLALGALIIVCMFGPLNISGIYVGNIIAMFLVLCTAYVGGAALGAGVGLALGMALCLGISAEVTYIGMLGISGMAAGTIRKLKKPGAAIVFMLVSMLYIIAFYNTAIWHLVLIETAVATTLFVALPGRIFVFAGKFFDMRTRREYEYKLHSKRIRELTVGRIREVSQVFMQTGEMFSREAGEKINKEADISGVLSIVAESTCKDCVFRKSCWDKDFLSTYNIFNKLFMIYEKNGSIERENVDAAFLKKCYNINGILSAAEGIFSAYQLNVKWNKKIEESKLITGKQLKGVAKVMSDIGKEMGSSFRFLETIEEGITVSLDALGIHAREVCAENSAGGGIVVGVRVKNCGGGPDCGPEMEKAVSSVCGARMKKVNKTGCSAAGKCCSLRFEQARRFTVTAGAANAAKGKVSGDSYSAEDIKDGRFMLILCDGMGSGENAKRESASAAELIEDFYQAGFEENVIFDTINRLLILKGNEDMFSTVDICIIDLKTGSANFTKIGAECSYILSGSRISVIRPGSLPIGILDEVSPLSTRKELCPGDIIVLMSDGVADKIKGDAYEWFSDIPKDDAQTMANAIIAKAKGRSAPDDDMTVMVSLINEGV